MSNIIVITNRRGESESSSDMPLWIFNPTRLCPSAINSILQFSVAFMMKLMILLDILYIFKHSYSRLQDHIIELRVVNPCHDYIFRLLENIVGHLFPYGILSLLSEIVRGIQASNIFLLLSVLLEFSTLYVDTFSVYSSFMETVLFLT